MDFSDVIGRIELARRQTRDPDTVMHFEELIRKTIIHSFNYIFKATLIL